MGYCKPLKNPSNFRKIAARLAKAAGDIRTDKDPALAPFTPIARCPMVMTVTKIKARPWVERGHVVVRPVLRLCGTFGHRVINGFHAGALSAAVAALLSNPEQLLAASEVNNSGSSMADLA